MGRFTWAVLHGHHHVHIDSFGPRAANIDASGVAVEPVVQKLRCRLHRLTSVEIYGIVAAKHGLSTKTAGGSIVVETSVEQLGVGSKGKVRGRHWQM